MPIVKIVKPCLLTKNDGTQLKLTPGEHDLPPEIADHWFVLAHSDKAPQVDPPPGTPAYAQEMQRRAARDRLLAMSLEQEAEVAAQKVRGRKRVDPVKAAEVTADPEPEEAPKAKKAG